MKRVSSIRLIIATAASLFLVCGCEGECNIPSGPGSADGVVVIGVVTAIEDLVPVDGGVTLDIDLDNGGSEVLIFGSLFTVPPPTEAQLDLYDIIRRVEIGDRVRAEGKRTPLGIELEKLAILDGRH